MKKAESRIESEEIQLNGVSFYLLRIEGGGSYERGDKGKDLQTVTIDYDFWMGKYPVTQELWYAVMKGTDLETPSRFKGPNRPVEFVRWDDITKEFLPRLNELTGQAFRLPTEAEWEYAARGGKYSKGYRYAGSNKLKEVGWYYLNSHKETKPVGLKAPNELELYDMSGNVREWCQDCWNDNYTNAPTDGSAWLSGNCGRRVLRGGSWNFNDIICRVAYRVRNLTYLRYGDYGFRLARS